MIMAPLLERHLLGQGPILPTMDAGEAKAAWLAFRLAMGRKAAAPLLSAPNTNVKLRHTLEGGEIVWSLALAPSTVSGWNTCPGATAECIRGCVSFSGKGGLQSVQDGRVLRTMFLASQPEAFASLLLAEISALWVKYGTDLALRLNTFSDLPWERIVPWLFDRFSMVRFYDYTKVRGRVGSRMLPPNYRLTYSRSEHTADGTVVALATAGATVAVVFDTKRSQPLPTTWLGVPVVDGDATDDRSRDPRGVVVGLRAKGVMRRGDWGFVVKAGEG